jgi:hypothetical protein
MENEVTQRWVLFYREVDMCYYLYNGKWPVCVMQKPKMVAWDSDPTDSDLPNSVTTLNEVLSNSRKKTFTIGKQRYVVTNRGVFLED